LEQVLLEQVLLEQVLLGRTADQIRRRDASYTSQRRGQKPRAAERDLDQRPFVRPRRPCASRRLVSRTVL